jgi:hypothetical protein
MSAPNVPATVASYAPNMVSEALARHACNVSDAAKDLGVPPSDLRRLLWANPKLQDEAFEAVEARLDLAEKNIAEALRSGDGRERLAASMFTIRNSHRARKRGWITSSTSAAELSVSASSDQPRTITFSWQNPDGSKYEPATESFERDGQAFTVPRYGGGDQADAPIDGELVKQPVLIERVEPPVPAEPPASPAAPTPEPPQLPKWLGPGGPPPLVAHLYATWTPPRPAPKSEPRPQPAPLRRLRRGGYTR